MPHLTDPYHPQKLYGLDHLRAFAISFVLLFHYKIFGHPKWVETFGKFGWTGVDLFFVLSGFLISSELFKEITKTRTISLKNFFIKRSFRILPAYLLVVAIYFLAPNFREREALPPLWRFLTFTQNFGLNLRQTGTFSHAWSLCVEEQFYLLLPLALLLIFRSRIFKSGAYVLGVLLLFGFAARLFNWYHFLLPQIDADSFWIDWYKYIYYPIYNRLDSLLMGIAISALFHFKPAAAARIAKHGNWFLPAGLIILAGSYILCTDPHSFYATIFSFPLVALGYGLVVICAVSPGSVMYRYRSAFTEKLAGLSYGIYLIHKGVIHLTQKYTVSQNLSINSNLMLVICILFTLLGAFCLQKVIERPFLELRKRVLK